MGISRVTWSLGFLALLACHNQSSPTDEKGQPTQGRAPDLTAVPPQPVVAGSTGPVASVAAADLARTVPPGPPNHDGGAVCHVAVENVTLEGRSISTQNTGNVGIRSCDAVVYIYDHNRAQIARVAISPFTTDGGTRPPLLPRAALRSVLPVAPAMAHDADDWFVPVVTHVDFVDGTSWDAPPERVPAKRPLTDTQHGPAVN
ncbi:MAG TPA: hypothetical protein VGI39_27620 [Polyangiaceae bacterium]|jgi:hypothetical protein